MLLFDLFSRSLFMMFFVPFPFVKLVRKTTREDVGGNDDDDVGDREMLPGEVAVE